MIQLHLGCGKRCIPNFIHVDIADFPHVNHRHDIKDLPMFPNDSVDLIYCSHALQYFDQFEAFDALREWRRVLKHGGVLRLAVPDFEKIVWVYLKDRNLDGRGMLGPLYGRMMVGDKVIYHKTAYDFESLKSLLELVGFRNVRRYDWRQTIHKNYDDCSQSYIPHMDKQHGVLISLNVETTK